MWSTQLFYALLKTLRFVFHGVGFLRLSFDRPKQRFEQELKCWYKDYLLGVVILLLILLHIYILLESADIYIELRELQPDVLPPFDILDFLNELFHDVCYMMMLISCWSKRSTLWLAVDHAQRSYKLLSFFLKERSDLRCSTSLFVLGISQLLLLLLVCLKLFWLDWPQRDLYLIIDYVMGAVHLVFALILSLHFFYHLFHAALLQSLHRLLQLQRTPKLLRQLFCVQPLLQRMNHSVASYFGLLFCSSYAMLCLRCAMFVSVLGSEEQRIVTLLSNLSDIEDETPRSASREEMLIIGSLFLLWQMSMMILLLGVAHVQQREHKKLLSDCWKLDFSSCLTRDMHRFMLTTNVCLVGSRPGSLNLLAWKLTSKGHGIQLVGVVRALKQLLQLVLVCTAVYYAQQRW